MSRVKHRQLTIRIPNALYDRESKIAHARGTSLNQLAVAGLDGIASQERANRLRLAYQALSTEGPANDVEQNGLRSDSFIRCEQVLTISKSRLSGRPFGRLSSDQMTLVDEALKASLGLP